MAGPYRGQILLQTADAGWSETHYLPGASLGSAQTALQSIATARMGMCRPTVTCFGLRVVDVTTPRLGSIFNSTTTTGTYTADVVPTVDPAIAIMIRLASADGLTRSRHYCRGIPQSWLIDGDPLSLIAFAGAFATAVNAYTAAVIANANLGVKTAPHTYTLKAIQTAAMAANPLIRRAGRPFALRRGRRLLV